MEHLAYMDRKGACTNHSTAFYKHEGLYAPITALRWQKVQQELGETVMAGTEPSEARALLQQQVSVVALSSLKVSVKCSKQLPAVRAICPAV
jgi:hypothetical protein